MNSLDGRVMNRGKVLNSADIPNGLLPANTVFIDRGSRYANPFVIGVHGTRDECCDRFDLMLANSPEALEDIEYLKGKDLACYCAPERCHGDTLTLLATMSYSERLSWAEETKAKLTPQQILLAA